MNRNQDDVFIHGSSASSDEEQSTRFWNSQPFTTFADFMVITKLAADATKGDAPIPFPISLLPKIIRNLLGQAFG